MVSFSKSNQGRKDERRTSSHLLRGFFFFLLFCLAGSCPPATAVVSEGVLLDEGDGSFLGVCEAAGGLTLLWR
jgi:hypothetical protein